MTVPLRDLRVLVVEDDYFVMAEIEAALRGAGAIVIGPAPSVARALRLAEEEPALDAALLDVALDGEMIFAVADRLLERRVPVVFHTGYSREALPARFAHVPLCEKWSDLRDVVQTLASSVTAPRDDGPDGVR